MNKRILSAAALAALISSTALGCAGQTAEAMNVATAGCYADGTYTGDSVNIRFGAVQVAAVIENGVLADVQFLTYPTDHESEEINSQAAPLLVQEAVQSQSAEVDVVSGATLTSEAFMESLDSALTQAQL
jgi:uncharacterized protein with FMN-binding domain